MDFGDQRGRNGKMATVGNLHQMFLPKMGWLELVAKEGWSRKRWELKELTTILCRFLYQESPACRKE